MQLSTKSYRAAAVSGGLILLLVGAALLSVFYPGNASRGTAEHSAESRVRRNARSPVASDFASDPRFKGTWLDPTSGDSTHNLGAWSKTLVEPTSTELKPDSAVDADFEQWKRERRDVAVVRRIEDARRQAPQPAPSDAFTPVTDPAELVANTVDDIGTSLEDELMSECFPLGTGTLEHSQCVYNTVLSVLDGVLESDLEALLASSNPAVLTAIREVQAELKKADEECTDQEDTAKGYVGCIREKLTQLEKATKDDPEQNELVKMIKRYYADVNVCSGKAEAQTNICNAKDGKDAEKCAEKAEDNAKKCNQKATDKLMSKLQGYLDAALL